MIPSKQQVKDFFRTVFKVVPGGPAVGTPGANRSEGALLALDLVVDQTAAPALLAQIDVAASAAAGVQVAVVNNLLVFSLSGTTPVTPVITPGTTVPTPVITVFTTTGH